MSILDRLLSALAPAAAPPMPTWSRGSARSERADSWSNLVTGLGAASGRLDFTFLREPRLDDQTLEDMFSDDPYASRIVRAVPEEALRRGFKVRCGDQAAESAIHARLEELNVPSKAAEAWTWARLFGGAVFFVGADDGRDPALPLDAANVWAVRFVTVLDKRELFPTGWYQDPLSPLFGEPELYRFSRVGGVGVDSRTVHASRLVRFDGALTTRRRRRENNSWCQSELQRIVSKLREFNGNSTATSTLLQDASQAVFKLKNLMDLMAADKQDLVRKRLQLMDMARSAARAIMLDADGEDFSRVESGALTGIADVLDKSFLMLAGAAEIPVTILMGQAPAGLSATGDSDIRWFYDRIQTAQQNILRPRLERVVRLLLLAKNGPTRGVEPAKWSIEFESLYQLTELERADLRSKQATVDVQYIQAGVLTPEEVAHNRFRPEGYSTETAIDHEAHQGDAGGEMGPSTGIVPEEALAVVQRVAAREIPRESGIAAIVAAMPGLAEGQAEKIMGEAGRTFFTVPDPAAVGELDQVKKDNARLARQVQGLRSWNARIVQRAKDGGLELGGLTSAPPTEIDEGDELREGDVVAVPADAPAGTDLPASGAVELEKADGRTNGRAELDCSLRAAFATQDANGSGQRPEGVAIVLPLSIIASNALASFSDHPDDLHCTLVYLSSVSTEQLETLRSIVASWAARTGRITATLSGPGRFAGPDTGLDPVWLSVDAPALDRARSELVEAVEAAGLAISREHGFVPHVTLGYLPREAPLPSQRIAALVEDFRRVEIWQGDTGEPFALAGTP